MTANIDYRIIQFSSAEYKLALTLRENILRHPLGLLLSDADTANEDQQIHLGAFDQTELIGCVVVSPLIQTENGYRIRQMAVNTSHQGQGIGRQLVLRAEKEIIARHGRVIVLAARISARTFYEKLNYTAVSAEFISNTIPHINMEKSL